MDSQGFGMSGPATAKGMLTTLANRATRMLPSSCVRFQRSLSHVPAIRPSGEAARDTRPVTRAYCWLGQ